jgi:hypothetical protein
VCNVSFVIYIACVLCFVWEWCVILCDICICVLCLIIVTPTPGENPFAVLTTMIIIHIIIYVYTEHSNYFRHYLFSVMCPNDTSQNLALLPLYHVTDCYYNFMVHNFTISMRITLLNNESANMMGPCPCICPSARAYLTLTIISERTEIYWWNLPCTLGLHSRIRTYFQNFRLQKVWTLWSCKLLKFGEKIYSYIIWCAENINFERKICKLYWGTCITFTEHKLKHDCNIKSAFSFQSAKDN